MFDIGFLELVMVGLVALLVLGPEKLPGAARTAGQWVGKARRLVAHVSQEIDRQAEIEELRAKLQQEAKKIGVEDVQRSVQSALDEARRFEHLVEKVPESSATPSSPQPPPTTSDTKPN